jgi:pre-mRNA-splicing factor CWC26
MDPEIQRQLNLGRKQREAQEANVQEMQILQQSTFARHADDDRLEDLRKSEIRKDDPMAAYAYKKTKKQQDASGVPQRPVYKGPPPRPNRYGIRPGYRWDGVDRANNFEDKLLTSNFSVKRRKEEAYKYTSADM